MSEEFAEGYRTSVSATTVADSDWAARWRASGMPWRTEPEIPYERQRDLESRRAQPSATATPNTYPFGGLALTRADLEWLLATHDSGRGPIDWDDPAQRTRDGLDLRGATLTGANLSGLPLAHLRGGLDAEQWHTALPADIDAAALTLDSAILRGADLRGAILIGARLRGADLSYAKLDAALLGGAHLDTAVLSYATLADANLDAAHANGAALREIVAPRASLTGADLAGAAFDGAQLQGAVFRHAQLQGADLGGAALTAVDFTTANLAGASLQGARFDERTNLRRVTLDDREHGAVCVVDLAWNGAKLSVFTWPKHYILGDEREARRRTLPNGRKKSRERRIEDAETALRAYRQVAGVLRSQGIDDLADQFAYRGWIAKRRQLQRQGARKLPNLWTTAIVGAFTGYGYRPWRSVAWYLVLILGFAAVYLLTASLNAPALRWDQALTLSVSSFHGRGFFTPDVTLTDTYARVGAVESVVGFIVELGFIATLTQRFFDK